MTDNQQLDRWRGDFGDAYVDRNSPTPEIVEIQQRVFQRALSAAQPHPESILEVGCNIGINLRALQAVSSADLFAIEPNSKARDVILQDNVLDEDHLFDGIGGSLPLGDNAVSLAFTCGVLIHIPEPDLQKTLHEIYRVSSQYILCLEYFARDPVTISYHDHGDMLFKRDFGGLYLDLFPDLEIVDDGFFWRRSTGADDLTWCLLKKPGS